MLHLGQQPLFFEIISLFFLSCISLELFISSFGPNSVNASLSVSLPLLEIPKLLNFLFLGFLQSPLFLKPLLLQPSLIFIVLNNLLLFLQVLQFKLILQEPCHFIYLLCLLKHSQVLFPFFICLPIFILQVHFLLPLHVHLLPFDNVLPVHPLDRPLLNLLDDDRFAIQQHLLSLFFFLLHDFQGFQSLDLHHQIELGLLLEKLSFQAFVFSKLFVSNGHHLRVKNHPIHCLHVVKLVVQCLLRFGQDAVSLLSILRG